MINLNKIDEMKIGERVKELAAQGYSTEKIAELLKSEGMDVSHMAVHRFLRGAKEDVENRSAELECDEIGKDKARESHYGSRALLEIKELDKLIAIGEEELAQDRKFAITYRSSAKISPVYDTLKTLQFLQEKKGRLLKSLPKDIYEKYIHEKNSDPPNSVANN